MDGVADPCLSDAVVQAWLSAELVGAELASVKRHIDGCVECRRLVAAVLQTATSPRGSSPVELGAGDTVDRYVIVSRIGAGSMGVVYRARDPQLGREVALKIVHAQVGNRAQLLREAEVMAKLSHPHVVHVYDAGVMPDERVFITMELVVGTTLTRWLAIPRTWRAIIALATDVGDGLRAAHDAGLVHRDLKPENILVNDRGRACIGDFGLALQPSDAPPLLREIVGTPAYMAPEQRAGLSVDARADQFALAVVLYESFYRSRPVLADDDSTSVRPPAGSRVPRAIFGVLRRALERDPAARYPSVAALTSALQRIARRRRRYAAVIAGVVGAAVIAAFAARMAHRAPAPWRADVRAFSPTFDEAVDDVALSPNGHTIAFTSNRENPDRPQLYVQPITGGSAHRVGSTDGSFSNPRWAADGSSIYAVDSAGLGWRLPLDDRPQTQIATGVRTIDDCAGTLLLHETRSPDCDACERLVARTHGVDREVYRTPDGFFVRAPRCDRAGRRATFTIDNGDETGTANVWLVELATAAASRLTGDPFSQNHAPSFTPDGDHVVFTKTRANSTTMWTASITSPELATEIPHGPGNARTPLVSADGHTLVYVAEESSSGLFAHELTTGIVRRLHGPIEDVSAPFVTRDGRALIATVVRDATVLLFRIDLASGEERIVGEGSVLGLSPTGADMIVSLLDEIFAMPAEGGEMRLIAPLPDRAGQASVGADGQLHYIVAGGSKLEGWTLDLRTGVRARASVLFELPAPTGGWRAEVTIAGPTPMLTLIPPAGWSGPRPAEIPNVGPPVAWSAAGDALYYASGESVHRVSVPAGTDTTILTVPGLRTYALPPDASTLYTVQDIRRAHLMRVVNFGP